MVPSRNYQAQFPQINIHAPFTIAQVPLTILSGNLVLSLKVLRGCTSEGPTSGRGRNQAAARGS